MEGILVKWCRRCDTTKPLDDFHRLRKNADGRQTYCKVCKLAESSKYKEENKEKVKASSARWRSQNAERAAQINREYRLMNRAKVIEQNRARYLKNREIRLEDAKRYREENLDKIKERRARTRLHDKSRSMFVAFGITLSQRDAMIESQGGGCAICGDRKSSNGRSLVVDHCHESSVVRGILCDHCNRGLGFFRDSTDRLSRAIEYLSASRSPMRLEQFEIDEA